MYRENEIKMINVVAVNGLAHCRNAVRYTIKGSEGVRLNMVRITCDGSQIDMDYDEFVALSNAVINSPEGPLIGRDEEIYVPNKK